jgi:hypothetical protein
MGCGAERKSQCGHPHVSAQIKIVSAKQFFRAAGIRCTHCHFPSRIASRHAGILYLKNYLKNVELKFDP